MNTYDKHGQSAAKSLSSLEYEKGSTTISRKESTLAIVEKAHIEKYNLTDKITKKTSGIYGIYCLTNNKIYIGSTINFYNRIRRHLYYLKNNKHHSLKLQNSYNKYGIENFNVYILDYCEKDNLLDWELYWINKLDSFINGFNNTNICKKPSNFKLTKHQIKKRTNISSKAVVCLNMKGNYVTEYASLTKAAQAINDQTTNISSCCKGKLNYVKNFIFVYKNKYDPLKDYSYKSVKRKFTKEHKEKISKALKSNKLKKTEKQIETLKKRSSKPIIKLDMNENIINIYDSLKSCCLDNQLYTKTLIKKINLKTSIKGFLYRFQ